MRILYVEVFNSSSSVNLSWYTIDDTRKGKDEILFDKHHLPKSILTITSLSFSFFAAKDIPLTKQKQYKP